MKILSAERKEELRPGGPLSDREQWVFKKTVRRFAQALRDTGFLAESAS